MGDGPCSLQRHQPVEQGLLAFVSTEHCRPAEQDRVETVEHDRRRDQKLLDA